MGIVKLFTHGVRMGGWREKVCLGCISETVRCRTFILGRGIVWVCMSAVPWCDFDLAFDLAIVTLTFKILADYISEIVRRRKLLLSTDIG